MFETKSVGGCEPGEFESGKDVCVLAHWQHDGKSLCYALLPLVFNKLTRDHRKPQRTSSFIVVISPLIALMKDQVDNFKKKGLRSVYDNSTDEEAKLSVLSGEFQLFFILVLRCLLLIVSGGIF